MLLLSVVGVLVYLFGFNDEVRHAVDLQECATDTHCGDGKTCDNGKCAPEASDPPTTIVVEKNDDNEENEEKEDNDAPDETAADPASNERSAGCSVGCYGGATQLPPPQCTCVLPEGGSFSFEAEYDMRGLLMEYGAPFPCEGRGNVIARNTGAANDARQLWTVTITNRNGNLQYGDEVTISRTDKNLAICGTRDEAACINGVLVGRELAEGGGESAWVLVSRTKQDGDYVLNGDVIGLKNKYRGHYLAVCGHKNDATGAFWAYQVATREHLAAEANWIIRKHTATPAQTNDQACDANYGSSSSTATASCPADYPFCQGHVASKRQGKCSR